MKKLFTLSAACLCVASASAAITGPKIVQPTATSKAMEFHNNYVVYTCYAGDVANTDPEKVVGSRGTNIATAYSELGILISSYDADNKNLCVVAEDYTDPETGATFKAGYYHADRAGDSRSYFATAGVSGMKNVKKMIFYWAAGTESGTQFSSYLVREGGITVPSEQHPETPYTPYGDIRWSMDNNTKFKSMFAPILDAKYATVTAEGNDTLKYLFSQGNYYNTFLENGVPASDYTTMACKRPLKMTFDFTQPATSWDVDVELKGNKEADLVIPYGHSAIAKQCADGKDGAGDPIAWSADNIIQQGYKKAAYLLGVAFICGDDNAATYYANVSNSTDDEECYWEEKAVASYTPLQENDDPEKQIFYSWKMTDEFRNFVLKSAAIENLASTTTPSAACYNLAGQRVSSVKGLGVRGGKVIFVK